MTDPEELLAMIDDAEIIDIIEDATGDWVKVGVLRHTVLIGVNGSPVILDTPERRDRFAKACAEAERRAKAYEAATRKRARRCEIAEQEAVDAADRMGADWEREMHD